MLKKISLILSSLICSIFLTMPVAALEAGDIVMSLVPSEQDIELTPGEKYEGRVVVTNVGRLPFKLSAETSPFYVTDEYEPEFNVITDYTRLHNWISLPKTEYMLEPGERAEVDFIVDVPKDIAGGGQYAAILLTSDSLEEDDSAMKLNTRLAAIIHGHVDGGELRREGNLVEHSLPNFILSGSFSMSETVQNTGNVDFKVKQSMTVTNFFTGRDAVTPDSIDEGGNYTGFSNSTIFPGTSRSSVLTWDGAPQIGLFRITQRITFLDQDHTFTKLVLFCPIWLLIIVIAAVITIIALVITKILRKRQPKPEAL